MCNTMTHWLTLLDTIQKETDTNEGVYVTIENPAFCLFLYLIGVAYIFERSYNTVVTSVSKKSSVDQSELEK